MPVMRKIDEQSRRWPIMGKIKFGQKTAKAMETLKTFRFMSPERRYIETLAELYGGTARPLKDPTANPTEQWQVTTNASSIRVLLPGNPRQPCYTLWYELWTRGHRLRQCDAEDCDVWKNLGEDGIPELVTEPCICNVRQRRECKPKLRLDLLIPELPVAGVWRFETGSWNAKDEVPQMVDLITQLQERGLATAELYLTPKSDLKGKDKGRDGKVIKARHYVVPGLRAPESYDAIASGQARQALSPGNEPKALSTTTSVMPEVEGELVSEEEMLIAMCDAIAFSLTLPVGGLALLLKIAESFTGSPVTELPDIPEAAWAKTGAAVKAIQAGEARLEITPSGVKVLRLVTKRE